MRWWAIAVRSRRVRWGTGNAERRPPAAVGKFSNLGEGTKQLNWEVQGPPENPFHVFCQGKLTTTMGNDDRCSGSHRRRVWVGGEGSNDLGHFFGGRVEDPDE